MLQVWYLSQLFTSPLPCLPSLPYQRSASFLVVMPHKVQFQGFFSLLHPCLKRYLFFQATFKAVVILAKSEGHTENCVLLSDMHRDFVICQQLKQKSCHQSPYLFCNKHYMVPVVIERIHLLVLFIGQPGLIQLDRAVAAHKYHFVCNSAPSPVMLSQWSAIKQCQPLAGHNKGST